MFSHHRNYILKYVKTVVLNYNNILQSYYLYGIDQIKKQPW